MPHLVSCQPGISAPFAGSDTASIVPMRTKKRKENITASLISFARKWSAEHSIIHLYASQVKIDAYCKPRHTCSSDDVVDLDRPLILSPDVWREHTAIRKWA